MPNYFRRFFRFLFRFHLHFKQSDGFIRGELDMERIFTLFFHDSHPAAHFLCVSTWKLKDECKCLIEKKILIQDLFFSHLKKGSVCQLLLEGWWRFSCTFVWRLHHLLQVRTIPNQPAIFLAWQAKVDAE